MRIPLPFLSLLFFLVPTTGFSAGSQVQMLVPGFTVTELPVKLSNINSLRFAPDGTLTALGYDGRVHLLIDTDGDGLEDTVKVFWDKSPLRVPVGMAWTKQGLYVSSHKKVSLLLDTDRDGKADVEEVIASGWPPTDANTQGVDATAVTVDEEGNVYFALLVADYANAYRIKDGVARYDIASPRGTIQKWSPKTKKLETLATGLRVPYTLAFNRVGDLFVTDQEGETWMPNGNPVDELNHILPGRNYGFPPAHPNYLPNLISEAPVLGFGPQHQSTCGFIFNERLTADSPSVRLGFSPARKAFGPAWWEGDAIVAGESRGKIWRARLVKTPSGYVGKQTLIASLGMLTTDVAVSPQGDLYVSCHSGPPDWGTGPQGTGKIFKISYHDTSTPQPLAIWSESALEVRVAFDRPLAASAVQGLVGREIEFGEFVRAADRLEVLKPPYQVVKFQESTPRGRLKISSVRLLKDHSVLSLSTDPYSIPVHYALSLPGTLANSATALDLEFDLNGIRAEWRSAADASVGWDGWLPHLDAGVNASFLSNSFSYTDLMRQVQTPGRLRYRGQFALPPGQMTLLLERPEPFTLVIEDRSRTAIRSNGIYGLEVQINSDGKAKRFQFEHETGPRLSVGARCNYQNAGDPTVRPIPLAWFQVPWASSYTPLRMPEGKGPEFAGGDWQRGKNLFISERLKCSSCHRIRDEGASLAPDLSNLSHRDAASVLRDIREPNLAINPDFVAYKVVLSGGEELNGFVRAQNEQQLRVQLADGKERTVARSSVQNLEASSISLMPSGLLDGLSETEIRDLLFFLLNPAPAASTKGPIRTRAEVERLLPRNPIGKAANQNFKALHITLVASRQDHPEGEHDYPQWQLSWVKLWENAPAVTVRKAWLWPNAEQLSQSDVLVFYFWNHDWSAEKYQALDAFLERGGGIVLLHSACIADKDPEMLTERIGLAAQPVRSKYRHGALDLKITAPDHPIVQGLETIHFVDETYWPLIGDVSRVNVLATAEEEGKPWPMLWTFQKAKGRVFGSVLGHYTWTHEDPLFQLIALRGVAWVARERTDRFEPLLSATLSE